MMLDYLGWKEAGALIIRAVEETLKAGQVTADFAQLTGQEGLSTSAFSEKIIDKF